MRLAERFCLLLLSGAALAACNSDSENAPVAQFALPAHGTLQTGATEADLGMQISPALTPAFNSSIHDYVVDCSDSPTAEISVAEPRSIGFHFLGTSGTADPAQLEEHVRLRRSITLQPGQGFRFALAALGNYSVRCLPPDFPPLTVEINGTPQAQWYLFSPDLGPATAYYTIMTDSHGTPVWWWKQADLTIYDAKVLGADEIAWSPAASGTAAGSLGSTASYVLRRFDGTVLNTLTGNLDFHDMQVTPSGTYLVFRDIPRVCPPDCADMSAWGGKAQDGVLDAEILEIDGSSQILWSWRTRDHIALSETGDSGWYPGVGEDIIHMNALEPDGTDALIFSARHLNAIYHITKSTGAIDWKIGGTPRAESLTVIGDPRPTATQGQVLSGQHDVRKWSDGSISVHDNGTLVERPPTVVRYRLDLTNRTAEVVEQIQDTRVLASSCCGAARLLPGGHWLVQWGTAPFVTELDTGGRPVLTIQYNLGTVFSYRAVPVLYGVVSADTLRNGMDAMSRH